MKRTTLFDYYRDGSNFLVPGEARRYIGTCVGMAAAAVRTHQKCPVNGSWSQALSGILFPAPLAMCACVCASEAEPYLYLGMGMQSRVLTRAVAWHIAMGKTPSSATHHLILSHPPGRPSSFSRSCWSDHFLSTGWSRQLWVLESLAKLR